MFGIKTAAFAIAVLALLQAPFFDAPTPTPAQGSSFRPYWSYEIGAAVTQMAVADIDGDGFNEILASTADNWIYALRGSGGLDWRYDVDSRVTALLARKRSGNLGGEVVGGTAAGAVLALSDGQPIWQYQGTSPVRALAVATPDEGGEPAWFAGWENGLIGRLDGRGRLLWSFSAGHPVNGLQATALGPGGQLRLIPSIAGGRQVVALNADGSLAWSRDVGSEIALVQAATQADERGAVVVALTVDWQLLGLGADGQVLWKRSMLPASQSVLARPQPGQLAICRPRYGGSTKIAVLTPWPVLALHVLEADGTTAWQRVLGPASGQARMATADVDHDEELDIAVVAEPQDPIYLVWKRGEQLTKYRPTGDSVAVAYVELSGDDWGRLVIGSNTAVQVVGASNVFQRGRLWQSEPLARSSTRGITALVLADPTGTGRHQVVAGTQEGQVYGLGGNGQVLWKASLPAPVTALDSGDPEHSGRDLIVASTASHDGGNNAQIIRLEGERVLWNVSVGDAVTGLVVADWQQTPAAANAPAAAILAAVQTRSGGAVIGLDMRGAILWQRIYADKPLALDQDGQVAVVALANGEVQWLTLAGQLAAPAAGTTSAKQALPASRLAPGWRSHTRGPGVDHELTLKLPVREATTLEAYDADLQLLSDGRTIWQTSLEGEILSLAAGDMEGDGELYIAAGSDRGHVFLFGPATDEPALLTDPAVAKTRAGYAYSISVDDPGEETITVTLEIWLPAAKTWLTHGSQVLPGGKGRLSWHVADPFGSRDAGQDAFYRFQYDDGAVQGTTGAALGPVSIPTIPAGRLAAMFGVIGLAVVVGGVFSARAVIQRRAHRRSALGQAEAVLRQVQARPSSAVALIHQVAAESADRERIMGYLPGLAQDAGQERVSALAEGYRLLLSRPEYLADALRTLLAALDGLAEQEPPWQLLPALYRCCLDALQAQGAADVASSHATFALAQSQTGELARVLGPLALPLARLAAAAHAFECEEQVQPAEDKAVYLAQAVEQLGHAARDLPPGLAYPERLILGDVTDHWSTIAAETLRSLQGRAQLAGRLVTQQVLAQECVTLALSLRNLGHSPATALRAQLVAGDGYDVVDGEASAEQLDRGQRVDLRFAVRPHRFDRLDVCFEIQFDDADSAGKSQTMVETVQIMPVPGSFVPIANPYTPGVPVAGSSAVFVGREEVLNFVRRTLSTRGRPSVLMLTGERRMGKTSLLRRLPQYLGDECVSVYVDGQSLAIAPGMPGFFNDLALTISTALRRPPPDPAVFASHPSLAFEHDFLASAMASIGDRRLVLLFDEFEELQERVDSGLLAPEVFGFLRHLMQHTDRVSFVFAGVHQLNELNAGYWSAFFNAALHKSIGLLGEDAARTLIVQPVAGQLIYDDLAVAKVLRSCGGHPYLMQLMCHTLVWMANEGQRNYVTVAHVNEGIEQVLSLGEAYFVFLWEQTSPAEREVLRTIALRPLAPPARPNDHGMSELAYGTDGLGMGEERAVLAQLLRRGLLTRDGQSLARFQFGSDLLRLWILQQEELSLPVLDSGY